MRTYDLLADILMPVMFFSGRVQLTGMCSERERERICTEGRSGIEAARREDRRGGKYEAEYSY